ncbi:898_t:CDS:1, partial [Paraglomus occultum]
VKYLLVASYLVKYRKPANSLTIIACRFEINDYSHLNLPANKSCILAAGIVDTKPQQQQDQIFFRISASQHKDDKTPLTNAAFSAHTTPLNAPTSAYYKLQPQSIIWTISPQPFN